MTRQSGFTVWRDEMDLPVATPFVYFLHELARPPFSRLLQMPLALLTLSSNEAACCLAISTVSLTQSSSNVRMQSPLSFCPR